MIVKLVLSALLITSCMMLEKVVNYSQEPYTSLQTFFGPGGVQTPDACGDKLKHLSAVHDPILNRNVFVHTLHCNSTYMDNDRCLNEDRQRVELAVYSGSDKWMIGKNGMQFSYAWKFFAEQDIKLSGDFCHIHQIKLEGYNVGNPCLTVTLRKDRVQLLNIGRVLSNCSLSQFVGNWIQFREKITYGKDGCLTFTASRIKDGKVLLSYTGCDVVLDDSGITIIPKFGFYRSLLKSDQLRDQSIKIVDLCLGQGDSCRYNVFGEPQIQMLRVAQQ